MNLGQNTFCAPSAGSAARINTLPAIPVGSGDGRVPTKCEHRRGASVMLQQGGPWHGGEGKVVWARKHILFALLA